ncbi:hypothetical protein WOLCODRAFT_151895 [Wolfiporia cocos MD-104 SS10]|uniref:F-box domain-containing protein n=1 Tax=Wolfiporia cocos (strain MD-104) TaxID=742152 RepID=A0A2H3JVJ5_WOLCO|nr:hypothetical protein WOLCODRAFT_151895 [Wolfiporia cocos MD-104 SS10]
MSDEMEGQPAASCIIEDPAFDIEARILQEIEWHAPRVWWELLPSGLLPQFYSVTVASRIPIEIWDKILRYLRDERETLGIAEEVCKGWYPISCRLKLNHLGTTCRSMEDVHLYLRYIKTIPRQRRSETQVSLWGSAAEEGKQRSRGGNQRSDKEDSEAEEDSLAHVGTFAAMFAGGLLPRLSTLEIGWGEWTPGAIPQSVFLHLSSFHSITRLTLHHITVPSITVLLRLVCAFDRLEKLDVYSLRLLDRRVPPASRRWTPSPSLKQLYFWNLSWADELYMISSAELETSSGSATALFLSNALSCSDSQELLHHAGKALRQVSINPFELLSGANAHSIQPLRVPDVDLSWNVGLRDLFIRISGSVPAALLERAETYGVIQQIISSTCPTVLEKIIIDVRRTPSAASTSITSHVLDALRTALCPPDHPLELEKYTSLKSVELEFCFADESSKRQIEATWANLAPMWFPSLYSRGTMSLTFSFMALP